MIHGPWGRYIRLPAPFFALSFFLSSILSLSHLQASISPKSHLHRPLAFDLLVYMITHGSLQDPLSYSVGLRALSQSRKAMEWPFCP